MEGTDAMRVVIVGAGGVGGYLGARLLSAGAEVVFLVRERRAAQLAANGLVVKSPLGDFQAPVTAVTSVSECAPADFVVIACKAHSLDGALASAVPLVHDGTRVVPLLNGVAHLETLGRCMEKGVITPGIVHGALDLRDDGTIAHLTPFLTVIVGALSDEPDPRVEEFAERLKSTAVDARASPVIEQDLWDKFVFLTTFAGITCLMRASIGAIMATAAGPDHVLQLLDECRTVARHEGQEPGAAAMQGYRDLLTRGGSSFTSSMLRDVEAGRPTEAEHILGDMLARAQKHGVSAPLLRTALTHLQAYEQRRSAAAIA